MEMLGVQDVKAHLSGLLRRVRGGEEIIVTHSGEPVAKIVPYAEDDCSDLDSTVAAILELRTSLGESGRVLNRGETLKGLGQEGLQ